MSSNVYLYGCCTGADRACSAVVQRNGWLNFLFPYGEYEKAYDPDEHFKCISSLSFQRVRTLTWDGGTPPDNWDGTWNASIDRLSGTQTGTIPNDLGYEPAYGFTWGLTSTSINDEGTERTRVYDTAGASITE